MESLAYAEMAVIYEESVGDLQLRSISLNHPRRLRKIASGGAILVAILLGGLTAAVSTAFSDVEQPPIPQQQLQE